MIIWKLLLWLMEASSEIVGILGQMTSVVFSTLLTLFIVWLRQFYVKRYDAQKVAKELEEKRRYYLKMARLGAESLKKYSKILKDNRNLFKRMASGKLGVFNTMQISAIIELEKMDLLRYNKAFNVVNEGRKVEVEECQINIANHARFIIAIHERYLEEVKEFISAYNEHRKEHDEEIRRMIGLDENVRVKIQKMSPTREEQRYFMEVHGIIDEYMKVDEEVRIYSSQELLVKPLSEACMKYYSLSWASDMQKAIGKSRDADAQILTVVKAASTQSKIYADNATNAAKKVEENIKLLESLL